MVPGGSFNRSNDPAYPATVSSFLLDRFEVTVGRFRRFVEVHPESRPAAGAGAHPRIDGSGWDPDWDSNLPADAAALVAAAKCHDTYQMWTDEAADREHRPMNCMSWYVAFALCAWDGGRLPTEAEWNYAAAGGPEQRVYPWSIPPESATIDSSYAAHYCRGEVDGSNDCMLNDIQPVGSRSPKGDGRWGQADLAGSLWEWGLDGYGDYTDACTDCATISGASSRVLRSGAYGDAASYLLSYFRSDGNPSNRYASAGVRCARSL
ncbi:formylglycine-generating enzyme family protein [Sorangium sp. So ce1014]|uniref:formylglycine-generating enzyme family protein n=1 Tax=Sorangium sp. So ce1014 TaxID=3133326 RepID=UPI003F623BEB